MVRDTAECNLEITMKAVPHKNVCILDPDQSKRGKFGMPQTNLPMLRCMTTGVMENPVTNDNIFFDSNCGFNRITEYLPWQILCEIDCVRY